MGDLLARFRDPLETIGDVNARCEVSLEILSYLKKMKVGDWKTLYIYKPDNSYWVEEYPFSENHGGGPSCVYLINASDPFAYFESDVGLTSKIREESEKLEFWRGLGEEESPENCREISCKRKQIRFSVHCKRHHHQMIMKEKCPFHDD